MVTTAVAGGIAPRYPTTTTPRQTLYAPLAPAPLMPRPATQTQPAPAPTAAPSFRDSRQANRVQLGQERQAAFAIQDPIQRRLALQRAQAEAKARYQALRVQPQVQPAPAQAQFQQPQGGVQDVRSQALQAAVELPGQPPAPPPPVNPGTIPQGPIRYPEGATSIFAPRNTGTIADRGAGPFGGPQQTQIGQQAVDNYQRAQAALLGPLAGVFGIDQPGRNDFTLTRGDVPLLEAGLNFENVLLAERDRELGYNELARGANAVGQDPQTQRLRQLLGYQSEGNASPELAQAIQLAQSRATRGPESNDRQETVLKDQFNRDTEGAFRDLREDYARRGISGNEIALDEARIRQEGGSGLNRALAELEGRRDDAQRLDIAQLGDLSGQKDSFQRQSLDQLTELIARQEGQRDAYSQALANVFLETEREPFDLSGLTTPLKDKIAGLPVAGPSKVKLTRKDVPKGPLGFKF